MKKMALVLVLTVLVAATVSAFAQPPGLHVPVPAGWTAVDQEYRFGRDDLWEYINGAAELFLTYRFISRRARMRSRSACTTWDLPSTLSESTRPRNLRRQSW